MQTLFISIKLYIIFKYILFCYYFSYSFCDRYYTFDTRSSSITRQSRWSTRDWRNDSIYRLRKCTDWGLWLSSVIFDPSDMKWKITNCHAGIARVTGKKTVFFLWFDSHDFRAASLTSRKSLNCVTTKSQRTIMRTRVQIFRLLIRHLIQYHVFLVERCACGRSLSRSVL